MTCKKCKGLMIAESRPDYSTDGTVLRCINCGLVLDPLEGESLPRGGLPVKERA